MTGDTMNERYHIELKNGIDDLVSLEREGINFFRHCIQKTNQFSTKFVLNKVIESYKQHVQGIENELPEFQTAVTVPDFLTELADSILMDGIEDLFDLEFLNFVEANKLAMHLVDNYITFYQRMAENEPPGRARNLVNELIDMKRNYRGQLQEEYQRLQHKRH
jgi:hypothetical protein